MTTCPTCSRTFPTPASMGGHMRKCAVTPEALFWSKVDKNGPNGCWLWTAGKDKWGYGDLRFDGKHVQAHRLAWRFLKGDPGKMDCLHKCHNPSCCNPDHLYLGDDLDNARDRVVAGRHAWGDKAKNRKIGSAQVLEIRGLRGKVSAKDLAAKYGVSPNHISNIWARRMWATLP